MAKTYFLAPTRDCPPSGPITLGSIITSPTQPELRLNPPLHIDPVLMPISSTHSDDWKLELSKHKKGKVGLWASFLQMLGIGADASVSYEHAASNVYQFQRLETRTFWPTKAYVKESVMAPEVQAFLAKKKIHHNVYMITAVSVAIGASFTNSVLRNRGLYLQFGFDGTPAGVPLSGGPKADVGWGRKEDVTYQWGSDFVFAFRLREICYTMKKGVVEREFTQGALYGIGHEVEGEKDRGDREAKEKVEVEEEQFELLGLAGEDVSGEEVDGDVQEVEDDRGETCECVVVQG